MDSKFAVLPVPVKRQVNGAICMQKSRVSDSSLFINFYIYLYSSSFLILISFFLFPHVDSLQSAVLGGASKSVLELSNSEFLSVVNCISFPSSL